MINSLIAYNVTELEKRKVLQQAKDLYTSKVLSEEQWHQIKKQYPVKLYTPSIFMKVLLFIVSLIGMMGVIEPIGILFNDMGESGYRILSFILGTLILYMTEKLVIKGHYHYKSGVTEAGVYSSLSMIAFALLGSSPSYLITCAFVGLLLTAFAAIRYLNLVALVLAIGFMGWIIFQILTALGGIMEALMPFVFMAACATLYWYSIKLREEVKNVIFDDQFVLVKSMALLFFYVAGNYFVVRELSISLMGLQLSPQEDIPFALLFYLFTALIPLGYIGWGIKEKSILFIRIGLLTLALSVVTFKYYFSLGNPMLTVTICGALLIVTALVLFNYLKQIRNGFTREILLHENWNSSDLTAFIASQTLGGHQMNTPKEDEVLFKGGSFGGAGAGGDW